MDGFFIAVASPTSGPTLERASTSSSLDSAQSGLRPSLCEQLCDEPGSGLLPPAGHSASGTAGARGACAGPDLESSVVELLAEEQAALQRATCVRRKAPTPALGGGDRANLVNWMCSAAAQLCLGNDVLFIAVACLDELRLPPEAPQALIHAAACLWAAAKWAHGAAAPAASAVAATLPACGCGGCGGTCGGAGDGGGGATAAQRRLVRAEAEVLAALDYGAGLFTRPTVETFLRAAMLRLQQRLAARRGGRCGMPPASTLLALSMLLAEQSLLESQLLAHRPSVVAAACVAYAHVLLGAPLSAADLDCAAGCCVGAGAADAVSRASDVLRAVHAAVSSAASAGNPYACSLRWLRLEPAALLVAPITASNDARLAPLAEAQRRCGAAARSAWSWLLPLSCYTPAP